MTNNLTSLQINDDDIKVDKSGRGVARKKAKKSKYDTTDISAGCADSPFAARGLSVEARVQVIEVAQFESQKIREDFKQKIHQLTHKSDLLLRERSQQIELAKIICPIYDAEEDVWMEVSVISDNMKMVKKEMEEVEHEQQTALSETETSSNLVSQFLQSVVTSPGKAILKNDSLEVEEVLVVNESVRIDNTADKSSSEEDSLDHNVAARVIAEGSNRTGVTSNSSSVSE